MKLKLIAIAFLILPLAVSAQDVFKGEHFIEVTGTAQHEIDPNEIYVTIRLREFEENKKVTSLEKIDKDLVRLRKPKVIESAGKAPDQYPESDW